MPERLFHTPPVQPLSGGQRIGYGSKVGENLSSYVQDLGQPELSASPGAGPATLVARWQRSGFSAYIETIPEDVFECLGEDCESNPNEVLKHRILVFWRDHAEVPRASTR